MQESGRKPNTSCLIKLITSWLLIKKYQQLLLINKVNLKLNLSWNRLIDKHLCYFMLYNNNDSVVNYFKTTNTIEIFSFTKNAEDKN